jgi:signal peptidase I
MRAHLREILVTITLAVVIFLLLQAAVQSFVVIGSSMRPNLQDGQRILVTKVSYIFHGPEWGDVVVFESPSSRQTDYIKRVIALPGDIVEIKMGVVYINGSPLDEPYIKAQPKYNIESQKIPDNNYFVLGDNRNNSNDSHNGWTVPREDIVGKAWLSIWPPRDWGLVTNYPLQEQLASSTDKQVAEANVSS